MKIVRNSKDKSADWITVFPKSGAQSATVIFMHGLGDSADGWIDQCEEMHRAMPHIKFILPSAPRRPITLNGGMEMPGWYDITALDERALDSSEGIEDSIRDINELIDEEVTLGMPYNRIMVAGFSQGGAMSLFTGLQMPAEKRLGGILIMSGYAPGHFTMTPSFVDMPLLHCHGLADPVVQHSWAVKTRDYMLSQGMLKYELKSYEGLGHSVNPKVMVDAVDFIRECLADDASLRLPPPDPRQMSVKELKAAIVEAGLSSQARGFSEKSEFVELLLSNL